MDGADANDRQIFGIFLRLYGMILCVTLLDASKYIAAWCGERGVYPLKVLKQKQRDFYPSLTARLLYWPSSWIFVTSNTGLRAVAVTGSLSALMYVVHGHWALLLFPGAALVMLYEPCTLQWPWHCLSSELWWILVISTFGNYTSLHPIYETLACIEVPSFPLLFALRFLLFRVIFGFGKMKFSGSSLLDRMYVRPFSSMLPILSVIGLVGYRRTPRILFLVAYVGFFIGEMIAPFAYFLPQPYRSWAAVNTMLLMLGIQISGNFGTFNALTAVLSTSLLVTGNSEAELASPVTLLLFVHAASGLLLIPFNSWVSASWFMWPTLRRSLPKLTRYYEFLSLWRISNAYGVFPPNIMSALRQIPVYQVSDDGKNWTSLRYRYQPTQATDKASFIPLLHPIFDFVSFYYVGYGGFMKSIFDLRTPCANLQCRPINAVARNLLQDGDAKLLFSKESTELLRKTIPRYVRVLAQAMLPMEQEEYARNGGNEEWRIVGGTVELPSVSIADLDGPWLPPPYVSSLDDSDPCMTVWRRRSNSFQDALLQVGASGLERNLADNFKQQVMEILVKGKATNYDCNSAADLHDDLVARHGSGTMNRLRCAVQRATYFRLQELEKKQYFVTDTATPPPDHFDLYLSALAQSLQQVAQPEKASTKPLHEHDLECGLFAFTFLFAPILRVEASVYRRMMHGRCGVEKIDPEGEKVAPAGIRIVRQLARTLRFPQVVETLHEFVFDKGTLEYRFVGPLEEAQRTWPWVPPKPFS